MKGAPEIVLTRCNRYHCKGLTKEIDNDFTEGFNTAYRLFANSGERVLGFAMLELIDAPKHNLQINDVATSGYEFVGLMSMIDPPKPKVKEAVAECRGAGVRVIMVTGDHPLTAKAIATEVGILTQPTREDIITEMKDDENENDDLDDTLINAIVVTGKELDTFTADDWTRVLSKQEIVFSRTSPEHKLKIVEQLQAMGHVVAVTGDGVNDAPALKKADIGVAMGISGSDVARAAGDIVIMDDDFSSIVLGIKEGRVLFDNLKKATAYTITHLWPEVIPVLINIAFDVPLAMNSLNVLTIDCGTELAPAISLAYEYPEDDVMKHPPRDNKRDRLASWKLLSYAYTQAGIIETLTAFLGFLLVFKKNNVPLSNLPFSSSYWTSTSNDYVLSNGKILTAAEQVIIIQQATALYWFLVVACQIGHLFFVRTRTQPILKHGLFRNMVANYGVLVEITLLIIFIFVPGVDSVLQYNYNVPVGIWLTFLVGWAALGILNEGVKYTIRNKKSEFIAKYFGY
jgi:sodium/potassium-transporting ATPase subunit alpha